MSNTYSGIISKSINARLGDEKVEVRVATFVVMYNDVHEAHVGQAAAQRRLERRENAYKKATPAKYFVEDIQGKVLPGSVVYRAPEGFNGCYHEYQLDEYEQVGTLLKDGRNWVIEPDLEVIEKMRRQDNIEKMKAGKMHVGEFGCNHEAYMAYLSELDAKSETGMYTRRHGL